MISGVPAFFVRQTYFCYIIEQSINFTYIFLTFAFCRIFQRRNCIRHRLVSALPMILTHLTDNTGQFFCRIFRCRASYGTSTISIRR